MDGCGLLHVLLILKLYEIAGSNLARTVCHMDDSTIGKCLPALMCSQNLKQSSTCAPGYVCCRLSERIVTPDNGNSVPSTLPVASPIPTSKPVPASITPAPIPASSSATVAPLPVLSPASTPLSTSTTLSTVSPTMPSLPSSATTVRDATGLSVSVSSTTPPNEATPLTGTSSTGGTPVSSSTPPNGATPPTGSSLTSGSNPTNNQVSPSDSANSTPVDMSSSKVPPPLMGSIVADPGLPSYTFPYTSLPTKQWEIDDTIVVSAEDIDDAANMFDKKCELYHSMIRAESNMPAKQMGSSPKVMIFGGIDSKEKEFPHMAALGYGELNAKQWLCGGSLITENFIVTAAHCLSSRVIGEVRYAKLGSLYLDQETQNMQMFTVIKRIPHENYDSRTQYNDIALLQLNQTVQITSYAMPICLFSSTNYEDRNLVATGWGKTESGSSSVSLQKVGLELFTQTECQESYSSVSKQQLPQGIQESIQICAGSHSESKDTCQGDSGGPLQIRKNNRWYLVGITSVGLQCGVANTPGVYTRVAPYIQWIQRYVLNR